MMETNRTKSHGYAPINGLSMYYEVEGEGDPLVFIPPAFGFAGSKTFPALASGRSIITMDLQGHGRTADIPDRRLSIEQYAEDVVALLRYLDIGRADLLGESYGGNAAAMIAVRHPELVRRVATYSATFFAPPDTLDPSTTQHDRPPGPETRDIQFQRENYQRVAPEPSDWPTVYQKVGAIDWKGFSREELRSITAPMLVIQGDHDFVRLEHSLETVRLIPRGELAVIPSASHFALSSEPERVVPIIKHFLEKHDRQLPLATAALGYHPGETR
jgi:pimeloyl-ACP methyl ester carboxylesterase